MLIVIIRSCLLMGLLAYTVGFITYEFSNLQIGKIVGVTLFLVLITSEIVDLKKAYRKEVKSIPDKISHHDYIKDNYYLVGTIVLSEPYDTALKKCHSAIDRLGFFATIDTEAVESSIIAFSKMRWNSLGTALVLRLRRLNNENTELEIAFRPILSHLHKNDIEKAKAQTEKLMYSLKEDSWFRNFAAEKICNQNVRQYNYHNAKPPET